MGETAAHFAKRWDYRLRIKHIFMDCDPLPPPEETIARAAMIVEAVRALQKKVPDTDDLFEDLETCIEEFNDLSGIDNAYEARDRLNDALSVLYDQADYRKRVWIE
jgi:hypothetical protein